jgi:hypothetical protein
MTRTGASRHPNQLEASHGPSRHPDQLEATGSLTRSQLTRINLNLKLVGTHHLHQPTPSSAALPPGPRHGGTQDGKARPGAKPQRGHGGPRTRASACPTPPAARAARVLAGPAGHGGSPWFRPTSSPRRPRRVGGG